MCTCPGCSEPGRGPTTLERYSFISFFKACEGFAFLGFMRFMGYALFIFCRQQLSFSLVSYVAHVRVKLGS